MQDQQSVQQQGKVEEKAAAGTDTRSVASGGGTNNTAAVDQVGDSCSGTEANTKGLQSSLQNQTEKNNSLSSKQDSGVLQSPNNLEDGKEDANGDCKQKNGNEKESNCDLQNPGMNEDEVNVISMNREDFIVSTDDPL